MVHPWSRNRRSTAAVWSALNPVAVLAHQLDPDEVQAMYDTGVQDVSSLMTSEGTRGAWAQAVQDYICAEQVAVLAAAGHRRLGYALPSDERLQSEAAVRLDGVARACRLRRLPEPVAMTVPPEIEAGAAAVRAWRSADSPVTGVCAFDDSTALAILAGLRRLGLSAPGDLAVVRRLRHSRRATRRATPHDGRHRFPGPGRVRRRWRDQSPRAHARAAAAEPRDHATD